MWEWTRITAFWITNSLSGHFLKHNWFNLNRSSDILRCNKHFIFLHLPGFWTKIGKNVVFICRILFSTIWQFSKNLIIFFFRYSKDKFIRSLQKLYLFTTTLRDWGVWTRCLWKNPTNFIKPKRTHFKLFKHWFLPWTV